jgi:hypothetical protein
MSTGIFQKPLPYNKPIKSYVSVSKEREILKNASGNLYMYIRF